MTDIWGIAWSGICQSISIGLTIYMLQWFGSMIHKKENHRWMIIHCAANAVVTIFTFQDMATLFMSEETIRESYNRPVTVYPVILVMSLHLYHMLFYRVGSTDLWIHHIVMSTIMLIPLFNQHQRRFIIFCNYALFFLCGLPGGLNYYILHRVYEGTCGKLREKQISMYLNSYLRGPGIMYGAFYLYREWVDGRLVWYYPLMIIPPFIWNAQHFTRTVAVSYGRHSAVGLKN